MLRRTGYAVVVFLAVVLATNAFAQGSAADYPKKPITTLMGFAPGGGSDVMLSMVRPHLEKLMKTTFVPVYKPGSGSDIALTELATVQTRRLHGRHLLHPSGPHQRLRAANRL